MKRLFVLAAVLGLSGCAGRFVYRDQDYELPEEAIRAQRTFHARELDGITPVLEEQRQKGPCRAVVPTEEGLRQLLGDRASDDTAMEFYRSSTRLEELRALAQALGRAKLFDPVAVTEEFFPRAALPGRDEWLVKCAFDDQAGLRWHVTRGTRSGAWLDFSAEDQKAPDWLDRFVAAAAAATARVAAQKDGELSNPVHALWCQAQVEGVTAYFPLQPEREELPRGPGALAHERLVATYEGTQYRAEVVRLSPDHVVEAGVLDGWRDEVVAQELQGSRPKLVSETDGTSTDGFAYKILHFDVPSQFGGDKQAVAFVTVGRRTFYSGVVLGGVQTGQGGGMPQMTANALAFLSSVQLADEPPVKAAPTPADRLKAALEQQFPGARVEVTVRQGGR